MRKKGFTLIESLVALYVLAFGIIGAMALAQRGLAGISFLKNELVAANLAQEGLELIRNKRDSNFISHRLGANGAPVCFPLEDCNAFNMDGLLGVCDDPSRGCRVVDILSNPLSFVSCDNLVGSGPCRFLQIVPDGTYNYGGGTASRFDRRMIIREVPRAGIGKSDYEVRSIVSWPERFGSKSLEFKTYITPHLQ